MRWISQTIESAINQTWSFKEIIIIDDGSTDKTLSIARHYEGKSVKVISQENAGSCTTRNRLLDLAQGAYIQYLDADDLLHPQKIEFQMDRANTLNGKRLLLTCSVGNFYKNITKATFKPDSLWQNLSPSEWILARIRDGVWMNPTAWLIDHTLCKDAGPWDLRLAKSSDDDGEYILRIAEKADSVEFVKEAICYYRKGVAGSLNLNRESAEALDSYFLVKELCIKHLLGVENSEQSRLACLALLKRCYWYIYPEKTELVKRANDLADQLGGKLIEPDLGWKFNYIRKIFGWATAKKIRHFLKNR